jgi:biofilm PGA synthesis protein PgaD
MKTPLIIERPDLQAWQQKAVFGALTAVFWVVWVFLWLPLVTLLGWFFFGSRFQFHMIELNGYGQFLEVLGFYALVIGAMGGALIAWALYNDFRFRGVDRRKPAPPLSFADVGESSRHPPSVIARWRECAVMTVHLDADGNVHRVVPALTQRNMVAAEKSANEQRLRQTA